MVKEDKIKVIIASDSFKGSLSSLEVSNAIKAGIETVFPDAETDIIPLADGGEGTVEAFLSAVGGRRVYCDVVDPLMRPLNTYYGILEDGRTAIVELAAASGIERLKNHELNPLETSTFGTGLLIKDAIAKGCKRMIIGLGGSATNDGALGIAKALGADLKNAEGHEIEGRGKELNKLESVGLSSLKKHMNDVEILVACDVTNPLFGESGAAHVYGPQKGASPEMVSVLDEGLKNFSRVLQKELNINVSDIPGAGAAGGAGAGLVALLGAKLTPGFELISKICRLEDRIKEADVVVTGEGKIDHQTLNGKAPYGVAMLAKQHQKPVFAFAGQAEDGISNQAGAVFNSVSAIYDGRKSVEDCIRNAGEYLSSLVCEVFANFKQKLVDYNDHPA